MSSKYGPWEFMRGPVKVESGRLGPPTAGLVIHIVQKDGDSDQLPSRIISSLASTKSRRSSQSPERKDEAAHRHAEVARIQIFLLGRENTVQKKRDTKNKTFMSYIVSSGAAQEGYYTYKKNQTACG